MRHEWKLVRFKNGDYFDQSPHYMSRCEADNLISLTEMRPDGFTYKVMHRSDINKLKR